ncbi:MAG TPA: lysophospholipid acyltransferase family protein [Candidatus Binataceae bacterium]|nr:lysophospholipid acyltransferase family protein [Candidatus Binataceae bacterium]
MPRQIGGVRAQIEYLPVAALMRMFAAMPLARAIKAGAALGSIIARGDLGNRPIALKNLEIAFPELDSAARAKILLAMYRNWGRVLAEWPHSGKLNRANIESFVTYDGVENLNHALKLAERSGVLVLTAHYGNFELLPLAHSIYGYRLAMVHRPLRNPIIDERIRTMRSSFGAEIVERKQAGLSVVKYLRQKWHVAAALDLDVRNGVFVDFFGTKACTSDALARIAKATRAPVVPAFMVREGDTARHRITVLPVIEMVSTRDREADVIENTQRMTAAIEMMIRRHPEHWNWIHRRWKTRPPGEQRFY